MSASALALRGERIWAGVFIGVKTRAIMSAMAVFEIR